MEKQQGVLFIVAPHMTTPKTRNTPRSVLSDFNEIRIFFGTFLRKSRIPNFTEIRSVAAGPIYAGERTDETTLARMDGRTDGRT
jgi:hypothetical protein